MKEVWKDITGFDGYYQVSNFGRVKSLARRCPVNNINRKGTIHNEEWFRCSKILTPIEPGYRVSPVVHLHDCVNKRHYYTVKVLVAGMFLNDGVIPKARQVENIDGDLRNCRVDNLRINYPQRSEADEQ